MYLNYYKLNSKPFSISPDPKFLWLGEKHAEALASLKYGILENKGFVLLTGEIGTGKTLLINCLLKSINEDVIVATISDPSLKLKDFYNILTNKFKINRKFESKSDFLIYFEKFLIEANEHRKKVLLIIDEAQRLKSKLLDEVRVLSNIEFETEKLINIFFVGQRELKEMLLEERNRPLKQRITNNYHLMPLVEEETSDFILHRLKIAGTTQKLFSEEAIREIHNFSQGVPRLINIICDHSLLTGYSKSLKRIDVDVIKECAKELKIYADQSFAFSEQPTSREVDPLSDEMEIIKYLKKPKPYEKSLILRKTIKYFQWLKPSEQLSNLKVAGVVAITLLFGMMVLFFSPRFEESDNPIKPRNKIPNSVDAAINSEPPPMITKSKGNTKDILPEDHFSSGSQTEKHYEEIITPKLITINELEKLKINFASDNDLDNHTDEIDKLKVLESEITEENMEQTFTDQYSADEVQSETNNESITTPKDLTIDKSEEFKKNTVSTNRIPDNGTYTNNSSAVEKSIVKQLQKAPTKKVDKNLKPIDSRKFLSFKEQKFLIHFRANLANLDSSAFDMLNKVVEIVYNNPNSKIIIEGHADSYGGHVLNKRLSQFRANMIKSYLIGKGIDYSRITAIGFSSDRPIADNLTSEGRQKNRRVEIKIKTKSIGS